MYQQDAAFNQNSLFGGLDDSVEVAKPEIPYASDWTKLVRLNKEREMIGMYLSAHPMDEFEFELHNICNATTTDIKDLTGYQLGAGLKIGGMITSFRRDTSKNGNPYGRFTLEDYQGAHEFFLFGKNYDEYGKYLIQDLFVYIQGVVQVRGSDYRHYKPDPNVKPELELKIMEMKPLKDLRNMIQRVKISLPLQKIDNDVVEELTEKILKNKGDINVHIEVKDFFTSEKVSLFARSHRIKIDSDIYHFLKSNKENEILDYKVETK